MEKVTRLYSFSMANTIMSVAVVRETPKRYYTAKHPWIQGVYVSKDSNRWFPERVMAIQYYREILKQRIEYAHSNVKLANERLAANELKLSEFDTRFEIVDVGQDGGAK